MSTCNRCQISAWHPEARTCTLADCELRHAPELRGVAPAGAVAIPPVAAATSRAFPGGRRVAGEIVGAAHNDATMAGVWA